ncbi:hypothetical protein VNO77_25396 [Canavalia gladiata]|uniref:Uncharacterized protein n=1 Tax=Canavalia gladiata TaxID=3824 RepID=A0AAN9LD73_CANGL
MARGNEKKSKLKRVATFYAKNTESNPGVLEVKEIMMYTTSKKTPHIAEKSVKVQLLKECGGDDSASSLQNICTEKGSKSASTNDSTSISYQEKEIEPLNWEELEQFTDFDPKVKRMVDSFSQLINK